VDRPDHLARAEHCWQYYQNLFQQQENAILFKKDAEALVYGLRQFTTLEKMTITPAAHGWLFAPLYKTPMIRAFPRGFNYPIPRGWPENSINPHKPEAHPWENESVKKRFRGFGIVTRALAHYTQHHVSQFIIDTNGLETGLNCCIFENPNAEYDDFATLLRRPDFARLDFALLVGEQDWLGWPCFRGGLFNRVLREVADMRHISLSTNVDPNPASDAEVPGSAGSRNRLVPLRSIFPIQVWSNLQHFGLSGFLVDKTDLVQFFAELPVTFRSLHLSYLHFLDHGGSWAELLVDMREKLDWRGREQALCPKVEVAVQSYYWQSRTRGVDWPGSYGFFIQGWHESVWA
jgi:hypothetical protein